MSGSDSPASYSYYSSDSSNNSSSAAGIIVIVILIVIAKFGIIYFCVRRVLDEAAKRNQNQNASYPIYANEAGIDAATLERFLSNIAREKPLRFSPQQLAGFTSNFSKVLGSGGFGVVYKGEFPNGVQIAVKVLNNNSSKTASEQFMAEVGTIGLTYHRNLVRLYGFCSHSTMRALIYEYMDFGSLDNLLFTEQKSGIEWHKFYNIAIGTAKGIAYLHEECHKRIIHYDIKPANVLLDLNLNPKVADFGLATLCNRDSTHVVLSGYKGTPGYAAPEMWTPYPVTHKCDVYSFGMLLFEIVGRRKNHDVKLSGSSREWLPRWTYEKFNKDELSDMLSTCEIKDEDRETAERMVKVALWCVQYLPKDRPMMSLVVKMLEGGMEINKPPNPFEHLQDFPMEIGPTSSFGYTDESYPPRAYHSMEPMAANNQMLVSLENQVNGANTL